MSTRATRGSVPVYSRDDWERQYRSGRWDYLTEPAEDARYTALADRVLANGARDVLDVGCGTGTLRDRLGPRFDGRYVGVDWSRDALASRGRRPGELLLCADASRLPLRSLFDAVVLSEVLYYLDAPVDAAVDMLDRVVPGGELLISLYLPSAEKHPGWHVLIAELDTRLRELPGAAAHQVVAATVGRRWALHAVTRGGRA